MKEPMFAGCFYHSPYGQNGDRLKECNTVQGDKLEPPCSLYKGNQKEKLRELMSSNGYCPHGHLVTEITLSNGMKQAVGGHVANHPILEDGPCPLCLETGWTGLPYKVEPPKPTFVTNPEQK